MSTVSRLFWANCIVLFNFVLGLGYFVVIADFVVQVYSFVQLYKPQTKLEFICLFCEEVMKFISNLSIDTLKETMLRYANICEQLAMVPNLVAQLGLAPPIAELIAGKEVELVVILMGACAILSIVLWCLCVGLTDLALYKQHEKKKWRVE